MPRKSTTANSLADNPVEEKIMRVPAEDIPSGKFSVGFAVPSYEDYNRARRNYPYTGQQNAPYSVEELLFAQQLREANGQILPPAPHDLSERLKGFLIEDLQFLTLAFIEGFLIDNEAARLARTLAEQLKSSPALSKTINANQLPQKSHSITFHTPNKGTNMEVERRYQGASVNGCTLEEMMTAFCIATLDGEEIKPSKDVISLFYDWPIVDVQFVVLVFVNLFTMDDTGANKARELGKRFRLQGGESVSDTGGNGTTPTVLPVTAEAIS